MPLSVIVPEEVPIDLTHLPGPVTAREARELLACAQLSHALCGQRCSVDYWCRRDKVLSFPEMRLLYDAIYGALAEEWRLLMIAEGA